MPSKFDYSSGPYANLTDDERRILKSSDDDHERILKAFVMMQPFPMGFIRSLNLEDSKRECLDYNEHLKHLRYYQERVEGFKDYLDTIREWYKD